MRHSRIFASVVLIFATAARAQDEELAPASTSVGQGWSTLSGQTLGQGQAAFVGQVAWPGLHLAGLYGAAPNVDVGGRFSFNWGVEGLVSQVQPGIKLQGLLRAEVARKGRVSFGVHFEPGPGFYFYSGRLGFSQTQVILAMPVGMEVGFQAGSAFRIHAGLDVPFYVIFGGAAQVAVPIIFGGGLEYFVDRSVAITFTTRMGPTIFARGSAEFTLQALFGVAVRF